MKKSSDLSRKKKKRRASNKQIKKANKPAQEKK
jgi:hypothetical protein